MLSNNPKNLCFPSRSHWRMVRVKVLKHESAFIWNPWEPRWQLRQTLVVAVTSHLRGRAAAPAPSPSQASFNLGPVIQMTLARHGDLDCKIGFLTQNYHIAKWDPNFLLWFRLDGYLAEIINWVSSVGDGCNEETSPVSPLGRQAQIKTLKVSRTWTWARKPAPTANLC